MKKIKSFQYIIGMCSIEDITNLTNEYLMDLSKKGINDVEVKINTTPRGIIYTLIWDEK